MIRSAQEPKTVALRSGSAKDLDGVMSIMSQAFDPAFGEAWTRAQCAGILPMPGVRLTIAEDDKGEAVGFSLHRTVTDEAELLLLAVSPNARKQGIGKNLLDRFVADAERDGVRQVHLEVRENNQALGMYRSAGFRPLGRRKDYYSGKSGNSFDALTFARKLEVPIPDGL